MKKNDFIIVGILVALMFAWMNFYPALEQKYFPRPAQPAPQPEARNVEATPSSPQAVEAPVQKETAITEAFVAKALEIAKPAVPEQTMTLANDDIELTVSSYGGAVVSAVLKNYPAENRKNSASLVLEFTNAPALRYAGLPVMAGTLEKTDDGLRYTAALGDGLFLKRTLKLEGEYLLTVEDAFVNSSAASWAMPELRLLTGSMNNPVNTTNQKGYSFLELDTYTPSEGVIYWGKMRMFRGTKLQELYKADGNPVILDVIPAEMRHTPIDWVAVKNKFFTQVLLPKEPSAVFGVLSSRNAEGKGIELKEIAANLNFSPEVINPGSNYSFSYHYFVGPKKYSVLKSTGYHLEKIMGFETTGGWAFMNWVMEPARKILLWSLIKLYQVIRNYGVAIMLLTIIVRVIFWPITHKGTESMRRMQALQPQLKEIQAKFKDNPQRLQQETMKFYKENKVNPMGGCLPMFVQIPVFIALYTVLRSAIELRFSKFLWIRDLSEPENLFAGMIPIVGSLNILPLLMSATMVWQQKMTPSGGDPQQQKMMAIMMPIMMLFFFYTMPSGLVLYWTTSNLIMIIQMMIKKQKSVVPVAVK